MKKIPLESKSLKPQIQFHLTSVKAMADIFTIIERNFFYYSRGLLYETWECLKKANERNLITESEFQKYSEEINLLGKKLNNFIRSTGKIPKS